MPKDISKIKVGLELEFSNKVVQKHIDLFKAKDDNEIKNITKLWKEKLEKVRKDNKDKDFSMKILEPTKQNQKDAGYTKPFLFGVEYSKYIKEDNITYNLIWDVTLDISVIEIIIRKCEFKNYEVFQGELQKHIYGFAKDLGLEVQKEDPYISMTHINIDFETGFDNSFKKVLGFILEQEENYKESEAIPKKSELVNSHYIKDVFILLNKNKKFATWKKNAEALLKKSDSDIKYGDIKDLIEKIDNKNLDAFLKTLGLNKETIQNIKTNSLHYYAVNIEHLSNQEKEEFKRVEFRRNEGKDEFYDTYYQVESVLHNLAQETVCLGNVTNHENSDS